MFAKGDGGTERRVLLLPPTRKDGEVTRSLLTNVGLNCIVCPDVRQLVSELQRGAAAIVMTEEVIKNAEIQVLLDLLERQPSWSDLPVVLLMRGGTQSAATGRVLRLLGNVTLLERPAPTRSVVSAVQAAVRGRERQYQNRDQIESIRLAEAQARSLQERFEAMANSIPQLAWMAGPDGSIFWYNRRWHEYCGTTLEQMQGWGWQSVHDPDELPRVIETWKAALASGEPWEDTFPLRRHDGEFRWHLSRAMPFRDDLGNLLFWFGTNTDITEQRRRADERHTLLESERAARQEAERVSRMKDEFLANVSHELRTPLNAIFGWTQILKMGNASDPKAVAEGIDVIDRNVRVQTQLIEDLLDVSRIISGKIRLDVQRVELAAVVGGAIESVRPMAEAKAVRLEQVIDPLAGPVSGDPGRLQQVVWNLLTNAIKFTPKGGKIHVLVERVNSHVELSVTDTGQGISPEFLPHLFERFSQADASTTRRHGGLGLGLSIVKNLVELHGGTVRAISAGEGHGATFLISLPVRVAKETVERDTALRMPTVAAPALNCEQPQLRGLKVLVVDDERDAREFVKRLLVDCHAIPQLAASADEAKKLLTTFKPDLILSDIGMPGEDGYEFMRGIRSQGVKTPAIALTAFARSEDRIRSIQAGYQTHLSKPVEPAELITLVASLAKRVEAVSET
jgi:hypothetical protein